MKVVFSVCRPFCLSPQLHVAFFVLQKITELRILIKCTFVLRETTFI